MENLGGPGCEYTPREVYVQTPGSVDTGGNLFIPVGNHGGVLCVQRHNEEAKRDESFKETVFQLFIRQCSKHSDPHLRTQGTKSLVDVGFRLSSSARNLPNEQNAEALQRCKIPALLALDLQTAMTPGLCRIASAKSGQGYRISDSSCIFSWVDFPVGGGCLLMWRAELDNRTNVVALEPINCRCREGQSIRGGTAGFP